MALELLDQHQRQQQLQLQQQQQANSSMPSMPCLVSQEEGGGGASSQNPPAPDVVNQTDSEDIMDILKDIEALGKRDFSLTSHLAIRLWWDRTYLACLCAVRTSVVDPKLFFPDQEIRKFRVRLRIRFRIRPNLSVKRQFFLCFRILDRPGLIFNANFTVDRPYAVVVYNL